MRILIIFKHLTLYFSKFSVVIALAIFKAEFYRILLRLPSAIISLNQNDIDSTKDVILNNRLFSA